VPASAGAVARPGVGMLERRLCPSVIPAEIRSPAADDIASDKARQSLAYSWKIAFEALPHAVVQRPAL
jgi:hypothetical protein